MSALENKKDVPTQSFASASAWAKWLAKNHAEPDGIWLRIFNKESGEKSVTYAEALDEALCYGWIDGQKKKVDSDSWIQKFTPRRARSMWSKRNIEHFERLASEKRMKAPGLKAFEDAKKDGRLAAAYDSPSNATIPDDFLKRLGKNEKAKAFFDSLNKANKYAITWRLQTAKKPETRERRMSIILEMLAKGEKFH
ncbi:YdeI/OmpD-associated family protein [Taibaiella koreensis]|uniref:YdeI/OmpD-associated family protein n=1 Tax=Taibaiella koreensis TaxID=1268548 RepID=UPI000E5A03F1|nr:YdeI/OmpD-associated family protein [Taibaiella koreensis]